MGETFGNLFYPCNCSPFLGSRLAELSPNSSFSSFFLPTSLILLTLSSRNNRSCNRGKLFRPHGLSSTDWFSGWEKYTDYHTYSSNDYLNWFGNFEIGIIWPLFNNGRLFPKTRQRTPLTTWGESRCWSPRTTRGKPWGRGPGTVHPPEPGDASFWDTSYHLYYLGTPHPP